MSDELAILFESRETRMGRLPERARAGLEAMAATPEELDKQFSSMWLARRLGVPRKTVAENFDTLAAKVWGEGVTPAGAYDAIAAQYKPATMSAGEDTGAGEKRPWNAAGYPQMAPDGWDYAKLPAVGFQAVGLKSVAGGFSQLSTAFGRPQLADPMTNDEYAKLFRDNQALRDPGQFQQIYDEPISFGPVLGPEEEAVMARNETRMAEIRAQLDAQNKEAVRKWMESGNRRLSEEYREKADFFYELVKETDARWNLNPRVRSTFIGSLLESAGGVPAYAAMAMLSPAKIPVGTVGVQSSLFADEEQQRKETEGAGYDPQQAFPQLAASATGQALIERALGVERLLGKALGETNRVAGRVRFGEMARNVARNALKAGIEEGITEPTQGALSDWLASLTYDEQREVMTGEGAKRRVLESVSGFLLGSIFGGGVGGVDSVDQNMAAKRQGNRLLTSSDGRLLTPAEFKALRPLKTDAELIEYSGDPDAGALLVAAVNGDQQAMVDYNTQVRDAQFVDTEGETVDGITIGDVGGVPVAQLEDGSLEALDLSDPETRSFITEWQERVVKTKDAFAPFEEVFRQESLRQSVEGQELLRQQLEAEERAATQAEARKADFDKAKLEELAAELQASFEANQIATESIVFSSITTPEEIQVTKLDVNDQTATKERAKLANVTEEERARAALWAKAEQWADGHLNMIRGEGRLMSLDPVTFAAMSVKGASLIKDGVVSFAEWSAAMTRRIGAAIKSVLRSIYASSVRTADAINKGKPTKKIEPREAVAKAKALRPELPSNKTPVQARFDRIRAKRLAARGEMLERIRRSEPLQKRVKRASTGADISWASYLAVPISTRLANVDTSLGGAIKNMELKLHQRTSKDIEVVSRYFKKAEKLSEGGTALLELSLLNGDREMIDAINKKYGMEREFAAAEKVIAAIRERAIETGLEVGQIENYWPRHNLDVDKFREAINGQPLGGVVEKALADEKKKQGRDLTHEEREAVVNSALQGYRPKMERKPSNIKERNVAVVDVDLMRFYDTFVNSAVRYIERMNETIETRRFFGKHLQTKTGADTEAGTTAIDVDGSIGSLVEGLIASGKITKEQQEDVRQALQVRFGYRQTGGTISTIRALGHLAALGQFTSMVTQLGDWQFSIFEAGYLNTIAGTVQTLTGKSEVKRSDLGIDALGEEYKNSSTMARLVNRVFKLTGMHYVVAAGQQSLINSSIRNMRNQARAGKLSERTKKRLAQAFPDPADYARVVEELKAGSVTESTAILAWHVLSDFNPISLSEMPAGYLENPRARIFYSLKTFDMKRFDAYRREAFDLILKGDGKEKARGFANLMHLAMLFVLAGASVDWVKAWLTNKEHTLPSLVWQNVWKLFGLNSYSLSRYHSKDDSLAERTAKSIASAPEAVAQWLLPPLSYVTLPAKDVATIADKVGKGEDLKWDDFESVRLVPLAGSPLYAWTGAGARKRRGKKGKKRVRSLLR